MEVTIKWAGFPALASSKFEPTADATRPTTIRQHITIPATQGKQAVIANLKFQRNP